MKGFHHFYIGILMLLLGFFHIWHSLPIAYAMIAIGTFLCIDDIYQHIRNQKEPEYRSIIHKFYANTLWKIPFIQKINKFVDRIFGL